MNNIRPLCNLLACVAPYPCDRHKHRHHVDFLFNLAQSCRIVAYYAGTQRQYMTAKQFCRSLRELEINITIHMEACDDGQTKIVIINRTIDDPDGAPAWLCVEILVPEYERG